MKKIGCYESGTEWLQTEIHRYQAQTACLEFPLGKAVINQSGTGSLNVTTTSIRLKGKARDLLLRNRE